MNKKLEELKKKKDEVIESIEAKKDEVEKYTKKNPFKALGLAFAFGVGTAAATILSAIGIKKLKAIKKEEKRND